ncbi:MAG: class I SAM-dependent rRNA methyltransferase [Deltaproteobacteria bacterium]|nr:class I SAM-dependent rRNA methyltransferase [Deltaproteobacteria bacterium]MDZ4345502.1 class I SAM-dependent rRNA methyltransferase [Candidatus Binatia bacterium]
MLTVHLKKDREAPVLRGHPWIFSGAVESVESDAEAVGVADVFDHKKTWIARGLYNPKSQIRVRLLTWREETIDRDFFARRIAQALALRQDFLSTRTNAFRLINGEGDFLPGLIVDRYGDFLVCQFFTAGLELFKDEIVAALSALESVHGIFEKSEGRVRDEEGLEPFGGVVSGAEPPETIPIQENGYKFLVDVRRGQKTGFFLDQRDNRAFLSTIARGRAVLNCFAYSGAFSVYAFGGGATEVISIDSSRPALELAEKNFAVNGFPDGGELLKGDAFAYLKECGRTFDVIVLDPPSLAPKRGDVTAATGGYKFLNLHALKHLNPGGYLLTFSCSQHLSTDLFQKVVFGAAVDARRKVSLVKRLGQPIDHPVSLHHPEGEYLKGLALKVLD